MATTRTFLTRDGLALVRRRWPVDRPLGTVVLVHGISEHSARYAHVADRLNAWGWSVESYDQRGHGESPGQRGALKHGDDLLSDLGALVGLVRAEPSPGPLVLMGHSLGGLVVGRYAAGFTERKPPVWRAKVDAVVMISPALTANKPPPAVLVNLLDRVWPGLSLSTRLSFDPHTISRDPDVVQAYLSDPRIHLCITPRLARFILEAGAFTLARAPHWVLPTLLLYAGADRIVDPQGSVQFAQRAPSSLVSWQAFGEHAHELFNDIDQDEVFGALGLWLREQALRHGGSVVQDPGQKLLGAG